MKGRFEFVKEAKKEVGDGVVFGIVSHLSEVSTRIHWIKEHEGERNRFS